MTDRFRAGVISLLILFLWASQSFAQAQGSVEGIGFENCYRPDCWTPLIVDLRPTSGTSDKFQLQVKQEDLDRDHPIFTRMISLTGNSEGGGVRDQKFRMYFKPQPTSDGLPDKNDPQQTLKDLQDVLQVSLCSSTGKWLAALPITTTIENIDPRPASFSYHRGTRMVLAITNGQSAPVWREYQDAIGILENVIMIPIQPRDLPESVLGYDAVDAVVWLNADPADLKIGTDEKFRALESYVRRGGSLIICTPTDWQKMLAFGDLLPVTIQGNGSIRQPEPLRRLARQTPFIAGLDESKKDGWDALPGPFMIARATANPDARIVETVQWKDDRSPWLVRKPFGAGAVSWVAQDLSDPTVTRKTTNWPRIWDRVLDLPNTSIVPTNDTSDTVKEIFKPASAVDLGYSLLDIELNGKSMWLMTLAIVFFIGYWLLAGPGMFAYLVARRRTSASWFAFAVSALAATAVTVLVVRLTLRGKPEMRHMSLVRAATGNPATIYSRFGLYIPRDGVQQIELKDMAPATLATISALAIHPQHLDNSTVPADPGPEYQVMVRDADSEEPAVVRVPYRSTLKKFEADWTGSIATAATTGRIEGAGKLRDSAQIEGILTNGTGVSLRNIYVAYFQPQVGQQFGGDDLIFYMPAWEPGVSIDLDKKFQPKNDKGQRIFAAQFPMDNAPRPGSGAEFFGSMRSYWENYWTSLMKPSAMGDSGFNDTNASAKASVPMLSFFSRLSPLKNQRGEAPSRYELLRRSGRRYDVSAALGAGALIVVAESPEGVPIPIPLEVEGERVTGNGSTIYQFILPLDASALPATTQPSE